MAENNAGSTLIIPGGNNQFVVTYSYADGTDGSGANTTPAVAQFGMAGALNNTNPSYDFSALDNGKVYTVLPGESSPTIAGGDQQFAIRYVLPAGSESTGGYGVQVDGGNNAFVVSNNVPLAGDAAGNTVSVDGGNNAYVVAYPRSGSDGGASASPADATGPMGGVSLSGRGIDGPGNESGVTAGTPGNNSVNVNGGNNQYVVDYGNAAPSGAGSSDPMPDGVGMSGSMTTAAPAGMPSTADLTGLLQMSPFGRILDIPGVTPDQLIAGFASATAGNGASGSNPFAGVAPGTNPFAGLGGGFGGGSTAPVGSAPGGSAPVAVADPNYTYDFSAFAGAGADAGSGSGSNPFGGAMAGSNPFAGLGAGAGSGSNPFGGAMAGSNPFAGLGSEFGSGGTAPAGGAAVGNAPVAADPNYTYDFSAFGGTGSGAAPAGPSTTPVGGGAAPVGSTGSAPSADQLASLLQQSPFGALLNIPGFTVDDLTSAFSSTGGNPFGGNPFDFNPTNGTAAAGAAGAGVPSDVAAMAQSFFGAIASGSTPAEAYASFQNGSSANQAILAGVGATGEAAVPSIVLANT